MNIGIIPVGGKGKRLGLPFPKEMLPAKGYDSYTPLVGVLVNKMKSAGINIIYMVHGCDIKQEIVLHFKDNSSIIHINQEKVGFSRVLLDVYNHFLKFYYKKDNVNFVLGLPDSYFENNPIKDLLKEDGVVAALFEASDDMKVDRLSKINPNMFHIKTYKNEDNEDLFWGLIKFGFKDIETICSIYDLDHINEIGAILSTYGFKWRTGYGRYLDLGTWKSLNKYWS